MPKEDKGHEPAKDAYDMSDDDFQEEIRNAQTGPSEDDTVKADADKGGGDADKIKAKPPEGEVTPPAGGDAVVTEAAPADGIKPDDIKPTGDMPPGDVDQVELTHNGVVHKVTKEKYLELAQKGFDYDHKIGPHARLVQLINSDPKIAKMVHDYVVSDVAGSQASSKKTTPPEPEKPKFKPLSEYGEDGGTEEWLKDNMEAFLAAQPKPKVSTDSGDIDPIVEGNSDRIAKLLFDHDPTHFKEVAPHLGEHFENLTIKRSKIIERSYAEFEKFYDEVKAQVIKADVSASPPSADPPPIPKVPPVTPAFHVPPGGGNADRATDQPDLVWEMSNKDFDAKLATAKGF